MEIFYPNNLTKEEAENLSGWKLKVATLHFGKTRGDCVRFGYGYAQIKDVWTDKQIIHLVADKDKIYERTISLEDEIDWDNPLDLLAECGKSPENICKERINECLLKLTSEE